MLLGLCPESNTRLLQEWLKLADSEKEEYRCVGNRIAIGMSGGKQLLVDADGKNPVSLEGHSKTIRSLASWLKIRMESSISQLAERRSAISVEMAMSAQLQSQNG